MVVVVFQSSLSVDTWGWILRTNVLSKRNLLRFPCMSTATSRSPTFLRTIVVACVCPHFSTEVSCVWLKLRTGSGDVMLGDVIADVWQLQISSSGLSRAGLLHSCPALSVVSRPGPLSPLVGVSASVRALEIATNSSLSSSCYRRPAPAQIQRGLRNLRRHISGSPATTAGFLAGPC